MPPATRRWWHLFVFFSTCPIFLRRSALPSFLYFAYSHGTTPWQAPISITFFRLHFLPTSRILALFVKIILGTWFHSTIALVTHKLREMRSESRDSRLEREREHEREHEREDVLPGAPSPFSLFLFTLVSLFENYR